MGLSQISAIHNVTLQTGEISICPFPRVSGTHKQTRPQEGTPAFDMLTPPPPRHLCGHLLLSDPGCLFRECMRLLCVLASLQVPSLWNALPEGVQKCVMCKMELFQRSFYKGNKIELFRRMCYKGRMVVTLLPILCISCFYCIVF